MDSADKDKILQIQNQENSQNTTSVIETHKNENAKNQQVKFENYATSIMLGLAIAFLLIFILGITCVVSKFVSVSDNNEQKIFGLSVIEVTNSYNQDYFPQGSSVVVSAKSFDKINVGDFVICDSGSGLRENGFLGQVEYKNGSILKIKSTNSSVIDQVFQREQVLGVVSSSVPAVCGLVKFLLSNWVLWLFVVIPCICLIALLLLYMFFKLNQLKKSEDESKNLDTENENTKTVKPKKKILKKKSQDLEFDGMKQIVMQFDESHTDERQQGQQNGTEQIDLTENKKEKSIGSKREKRNKRKNKNLQKTADETTIVETIDITQNDKQNSSNDKISLNNFPRLKEPSRVKLAKPRSKKEMDSYIYTPLPPTDTHTPIRKILGKITNETPKTDIRQELLQKMRKTK